MSGVLSFVAAASALVSGNFDCRLDAPAAVSTEAGQASASIIEGLPSDSLKFRAEFSKGYLTIDWPDSPIQINGRQPIIPTALQAGAVLYVSQGPCLFTEMGCGALVNFARQPDGSLKLLVTPTAISTDQARQVRSPFLVSVTGVCTARTAR